jgi:hypothetical protein
MVTVRYSREAAFARRPGLAVVRYPVAKAAFRTLEMSALSREAALVLLPFAINHDAHAHRS